MAMPATVDEADRSLKGQTAIITGAGRGIGRAHAFELAHRGAEVIVNDIDQNAATEVVTTIRSAGGTAMASVRDVSTEDGAAALIADAMDRFGSIEVLINNAGSMRPAYFDDLTFDDIKNDIGSHLLAAFYVTRPAWPLMKQRKYGRIIMTSSSAGLFGYQGTANYAAAKAGIYGLTKALAFEGAEYGIKVNALLPWAKMGSGAMANEHPIPDYQRNYDRFVGADLPNDHWRQDPQLIARLVACLTDPSCDVSGEAFSICRGRYARVFVGVTEGWIAPDANGSLDSLDEHLEEIRDTTRYSVPMWNFDELAEVLQRIGFAEPM